ncbi:MAG TPA: hypothetical protein VEH26_00500 [Chthoniobacterales bacterium]|nr:hypothetical protein [Chthoniobacterales bacterium]
MVRACAILLIVSATLLGQDQSTKDPEGSFEIEPEILPQNLKEDAALEKSAAPVPVLDVAKLEKDLERARRNAATAEHFYKIGALAKAEAEARALKVVRLEADLENARLAEAKAESLSQQGETPAQGEGKKVSAKADIDLARAIEAAHAAAAKRKQAELEAAEINVRRQQKLLALGSGHKSDVARAEQKLAELRQANQ